MAKNAQCAHETHFWLLLVGGLSLLLGFLPRVGAALIVLFLIAVTPVMHAFWNDPAGPERAADFVNFGKNIALIGGACLAAALPEPWPGSLGGHEHGAA